MQLIRNIPSAIWKPDVKSWELRFAMVKVFLYRVKRYIAKLGINPTYYIADSLRNNKVLEYDLSDIDFKSTPYPYQLEGIQYLLKNKRCILGDEQGCIDGDASVSVRYDDKPSTQIMKLSNAFRIWQQDADRRSHMKIKCLVNDRFAYVAPVSIVDSGIKQCLKLVLDDGTELCLTPDHEVLTSAGWKLAKDIETNDLIICNGEEQKCLNCGNTHDLISYTYSKFKGYCRKCMYKLCNGKTYKNGDIFKTIDKEGYVWLWGNSLKSHPNYNNGIREHIYVMSHYIGRPIDTSVECVHHIDHNRQNNDISNLQLLTIEEHYKVHIDTATSNLPQNSLDYVVRKGKIIRYVPVTKRIVRIESAGDIHVFDIKFEGDIHNFVANGIVVHNCGKTLQLLYTGIALRKYENLKHVLIICGVNGNKYNWEEEVYKHTNLHAHVLGTRKSKKTGKSVDRGTAALMDDLRNPPSATFWIINIEKLRLGRKARKRGQRKSISEFPVVEEIQKLINKGEIGLVAFDEFHKCIKGDSELTVKLYNKKNTTSKITMEEAYNYYSQGYDVYVKSLSKRGYYCFKHIDKVHRNQPAEKFYKLTYGCTYGPVRYELIVSESHKIYRPSTKQYMECKDFRPGMDIGVSTAKWLKGVLYKKELVNFRDTYCYDLDVEGTHCYFANNLLVHNCKQPTSLQSQALLWIDCPREIAMTGTLIVNSPLDLYMPFKWLGLESRDYWNFTNRYAVKDLWGSVIGYQNAQELIDVLAVYQLRRLKKNVLSLPPKIYKDEYIELTADEWKVYKAVQTGLLDLMSGQETDPAGLKHGLFSLSSLSNPLSVAMRLRQTTADTSIVSDVIKHSSKLDRMEELCEELIEGGEKVIIFSNWTTITQLAYDRLSKYSPAYITGEVKQEQRNYERQRFQEDDNCKIIIGTIPALGTGFTLTAATNVIFLDEPWTKSAKAQCEDRAHRIGADSPVVIYTLIAKDTVDEHVHEIVENKGDISDLVVDGKCNPEKREQLMRMLIGQDQFNKRR